MADYGIKVIGDAGNYLISQDYSNLSQPPSRQADSITAVGEGGAVYYFGAPVPRQAGGDAALVIYKADGKVAFDSRDNHCRVVGTLSGNIGQSPVGLGTFTYPAGRKYAYILFRYAVYSLAVAVSGTTGNYYWKWDFYRTVATVSGNQVTVSQTVERDPERFGPGPLPPGRGSTSWSLVVIDVTGYAQNAVEPAYFPVANVSASPASASGSINSSSTGTVTSNSITISWTGGTSGSTKVTWEWQSGATLTPPSGATGSFSTSAAPGTTYSAVYRASVSDTVSSGYVDVPVTLKNIYTNALAVTVSPSTASYTSSTSTAGTYLRTTNSVTASGSGGTGTYSYTWAMVSGDPRITIGNPNAATTSFSASLTVNRTVGSDSATGIARCTIHDGTSTSTRDVPVSINENWTGPIN